jgi:hypothetical protein
MQVPMTKTYQHKDHGGEIVVEGVMEAESVQAVHAVLDDGQRGSLQTNDPRITWDYAELEWDHEHGCPKDTRWEYQDWSLDVDDDRLESQRRDEMAKGQRNL